ncbi:MAG: hypothetical protein RIQ52_778, partial [Pseudomonadota bacterium]
MSDAVSLYFIDSSVADNAAILAALPEGAEVHVLNGDVDGLDQLLSILGDRQGIAALHIFSHGADALLRLGSSTLDTAYLRQRANELSALGTHLTSDADILLYGCNIAQDPQGDAFISQLALLTGADVAASVDATGAADLGGNWALESSTGPIDTAAVIVPDYAGLLPSYPQTVVATSGTNVDTTRSTTGLIGAGKLITLTNVSLIKGATNSMIIDAYDVDYGMLSGGVPYAIGNAGSEWDGVYIKLSSAADTSANWKWVGFLTGFNNTWNTTTFDITSQMTALVGSSTTANNYDIRVVPDDNGTQTQANNG